MNDRLVARYATLLRPPGPGSVPRSGLLQVREIEGTAPSGHHAWGWAEYNRRLTEEELRHYDMEYVHSAYVTED